MLKCMHNLVPGIVAPYEGNLSKNKIHQKYQMCVPNSIKNVLRIKCSVLIIVISIKMLSR